MFDRRGHDRARFAAPPLATPALRLALVVAIVAVVACSPSPSAVPTATTAVGVTPASTVGPSEPAATVTLPSLPPSPAPTEASSAQCEPADIKSSHGFVEGGAGSVFTTVTLVAAVACSVDAFPAFGLRDADGAVLVGAAASGPGRIDLVAGSSYESNVQLANWCADEPAFPLTFELLTGGAEIEVTGGSFPEEGDLPPCNGDTLGPVLEASAWEAVP